MATHTHTITIHGKLLLFHLQIRQQSLDIRKLTKYVKFCDKFPFLIFIYTSVQKLRRNFLFWLRTWQKTMYMYVWNMINVAI